MMLFVQLMIFFLFSGILVSTLFVVTRALYGPSSDVIELTANNFKNKVLDSDAIWLVEFYAPW